MRRTRNKPRRSSWIAIIAVLSNVLAGALGHLPAQAAGGIDDIVPAHLICTVDRVQDQASGGGQDSSGKSTHCGICTLLSAGFAPIVAVAFAVIAFPSTLVFHLPRLGLRTLADHLSLGGIRSRAPPVSA